jgi:hypothetical protein
VRRENIKNLIVHLVDEYEPVFAEVGRSNLNPVQRETLPLVQGACMWRRQAFAVPLLRERRCRVYKEASSFRPGPRKRETLPRV